jgi:hypothetical protein
VEIVARRLVEFVEEEQLQEHILIEHGEHVLGHVVMEMEPRRVVNHVILMFVRISNQRVNHVQQVCVLLRAHIHTENGGLVRGHVEITMELRRVVNHVTLMFV